MLRIESVTYRYPRTPEPSLSDVSFEADGGELVFVLGPNGSGKSTLFRIVLQFLRPDEGSITVAGTPLRQLTPRDMARRVAYIPQQEVAAFNYTAWQTVLMGRTPHLGRVTQSPSPEDITAAERAMATLGIEHLAQKGMRSMSGGERQLVLIARALCQEARILVLDEPTSALDFGNQTLVLDELRALADDGLLVMISSHNPMHALQYADRVLLLKRGRIVASSGPDEITEQDLSVLYETPLRIVTLDDPAGLRLCVPVPRSRETEPGGRLRLHRPTTHESETP